MRFIYTDSQGKEVPIPTVEALALRIELGAITDATRFFDANADRWAPAGEHEIFRSLSRELADKSGGFVAPPPPSPVARPRPEPKGKAPNPFEALEGPAEPPAPEPPAPEPAAKPAPAAARKPAPSEEPEDSLGGLDFGLTLDDTPAEVEPGPAAERSDSDPFGVEMTPMPQEESPPAAATPKKEEASSFDFGGFGGMLTDDEEDDEEEAAAGAPGGDLGLEGAMAGGAYDPETHGQADRVTVGGGLDGMDMEKPLSDLPIDEGGWTQKEPMFEQEKAAAEPDPTQRYKGGDDDDAPPEKTERTERPARARPAPRPPPPAKSRIPALVGLVAVVALVGAGGWFGWNAFRNREPSQATQAEIIDPPVSIPRIAEALEPTLQQVRTDAKTDWVAMLRTQLPLEKGLPFEPDREWLGGAYLADASKFASIGQYWAALDAYLTDVQARDEDLFVAAFSARLDTLAATDSTLVLTDADRESLTNRVRAGFQTGRAERRAVYGKLGAVINASIGLHEFLLTNEDNIQHDPAAGGSSRDPVLEAIPSTPELGDQMWDLVDDITEALDGLGALDRVTTDRLLELFLGQLGAVAIR